MALSAAPASCWPARGGQRPRVSSVRHNSSRWKPHLAASIFQQSNAGASLHSKNVFIFGLGYTSIALGNWLAADGWRVSGTCRTQARVDGLRAKGWAVDLYDPARGIGLTSELRSHLEDSPYVLSSVPPLGLALYDPALSAQKALLRPLAATGRIAWFGYLSSTGVYGDWQGEWVDESSHCRQTSAKAIVRQEAEAAWLQMHEQSGLPAHIFRLGGIYGPGRSVLDALKSEPSDLSSSQRRRGQQRYTARCHVYDICAVLAASMGTPAPGRVYNVVDDDPAPRTDVMSYARTLLSPADAAGGQPAAAAAAAGTTTAPQAPQAAEGNGTAERGTRGRSGSAAVAPLEEKRVRNTRIREELGVQLRYPSYREGVGAIHAGECWPLSPEDLTLL